MKSVIGIIGPLGAGKDTAAEYLANKYKYPVYQISDALKELAKEQNITRENLIMFGRKISQEYGDDYLAKKILEKTHDEKCILVGMRQLGQINYLILNTKLILIGIIAKPETRFQRMIQRNKNGDPKTLEDFIRIEEKDNKEGVQKIDECMKLADITIQNETNVSELYSELDLFLSKIE